MKQSEEAADFRLCNLISQGKTMAEARAILAPVFAEEAAKAEARKAAAAEADEPKTLEELQAALTKAGVAFHPKAKVPALTTLWEKHKAEAAEAAESGEPDAS